MKTASSTRAGLLYKEAEVWSGVTGNGFHGELIDYGYMDEIETALGEAGPVWIDALLFKAALKVAEDFERRRDGVGGFLGWRITCLVTKGWRKYTGLAKFQVDETVFTTLLEAMNDIMRRVPRAREYLTSGGYPISPPPSNFPPAPEKKMIVDMEPIGLALTEFKDVSQGQPFLYAGDLYVKAGGVLGTGRISSCGGEVHYFGVKITTGDAQTFSPGTKVTLAETNTKVIRILPK